MSVYIFHNGKYYKMAGNTVYRKTEALLMKPNDQIYFNGIGYNLGLSTFESSKPEIPPIPDITEQTLTHNKGTEPTGKIFYVKHDNNDNLVYSENSWNTESHEIPDVNLLIDSLLKDGDSIYFAKGDYVFGSTIEIKKRINIYGGFPKNGGTWNERDAFNHPTVFKQTHPNTMFNFKSNVDDQIVDGISLMNPVDTLNNDATNITFRNMTISGGDLKSAKLLFNSKCTNCSVDITEADNLIVSNTIQKTCNITTIKNSIFNEDDVTCTNITDSQVYNGDVNCSNDAVRCTFQDNTTIRTYKIGRNLTDTNIYGEPEFVHSVSVGNNASNCEIHGNTNVTMNLSNGNIYGNASVGNECSSTNGSKHVITGIVFSKNITDYILYDVSWITSKAEKCEFINIVNNNNINNPDGWQQDSSIECNYYIYKGFLYYQDGTIVKDNNGVVLNGWTAISGYSYYNSRNHAYGICGGKLYQLSSTSASPVTGGVQGQWTAVSGYSYSGSYYAYGICDGKLYRLSSTSVTPVTGGVQGQWTAISGYSYSDIYYAYGICDGKLYRLSSTSASPVTGGVQGQWTAVSGYSYSDIYYAYGICDGKLYRLSSTSASPVTGGEQGKWTAISGYYNGIGRYAYGICGGKLYQLSSTSASPVTGGVQGLWTAISGYYNGSDIYYAYGICDGKLYRLSSTSASPVTGGVQGLWTAISGYSYSDSYYAYGICDWKLYRLSSTSAILIEHNDRNNSVSYPGKIMSASKCKFINNKYQRTLTASSCLFINCEYDTNLTNTANACTFSLCKAKTIFSYGKNNIYWKCKGSYVHPENASTDASHTDNKMTLNVSYGEYYFNDCGFDTIGVKLEPNIEQCPIFTTDGEGYEAWVNQFGDWHPIDNPLNALKSNKGVQVSEITTDLDGNNRPVPPTYGAYEYHI